MTGPHHRDDLRSGCGPDAVGQILVPLVDEDAFENREGSADVIQEAFQDVLLLHALHVRLADLPQIPHGENELKEELHPVPESHDPPGPRQGHPDVPVSQVNPGSHGIRRLHGRQHLLSGDDVEFLGDAFLEGRQHEVRKEQKGLLFPNDLDDIHLPPLVLLPDGLVSGCAELHTDRVGFFSLDGPSDELGALPGDMGRSHQDDLLPARPAAVDIRVVVCFHYAIIP
ncbi:uncharacterized protein Dmul_31830 [Desulfococcus multivorans]|nr:uncharacterized protein Dmul_31830 [Desulfococcus multivorans]